MRHSWLDARPDLPRKAALPNKAARRRAGVIGMLIVEAGADRGHAPAERDRMLSMAGEDADILGIVSPSELEIDTDDSTGLVRGIRVNIRALNTSVASNAIVLAVRQAAASARAVEVLCTGSNLAAVALAARKVPGHPIVIDHLGDPPWRSSWNSDAMKEWRHCMQPLTGMTEVVVKISGHALPDSIFDAIKWIADEFGTARCMLGSDWPVSESTSYGTWFEQVGSALGSLDVDIRSATARRVYKLGDPNV